MKNAVIALLAVAGPLVGTSAPAAICDIEVDPSFPLYMVTVDGEAFKKKRYADPDDALRLRDYLVESGLCVRPAKLVKCSVRQSAAGKYVVFRGDVHYDPMAQFSSDDRARRLARKMAQTHLCAFD